MKNSMWVCVLLGSLACSANDMARNYGGESREALPCGTKLVSVSWKEADLWYLTRPMLPGELPVEYAYAEISNWGMYEGTILLVESVCPTKGG